MNFNPSLPIYLQVADDIKKRIVLGEYKPGEKLPSSRELAVAYGINPNTAARVYQELQDWGVCDIKRGLGTYVTDSPDVIESVKKEMVDQVIEAFFREMQLLGYDHRQISKLIKEREKDEEKGREEGREEGREKER